MSEDNTTIDITAVSAQIENLKVQRNIAMNDVAILTGQLARVEENYAQLQNEYKAILELYTNSTTRIAGNETAPETGSSPSENGTQGTVGTSTKAGKN